MASEDQEEINLSESFDQLSVESRFSDAAEGGEIEASPTTLGRKLDAPSTSSLFPGYVETVFSTPEKRYFYEVSQDESLLVRSGSKDCFTGEYAAYIHEVYWLNPVTGGLELCILKTLKPPAPWKDLYLWREHSVYEIEALRRVSGLPGVVGLRDVFIDRDVNTDIHIIMEKVPGINLETRIILRTCEVVGLSWRQIVSVLRQIAKVLSSCLNSGLVHADVKPSNIMISKDKSSVTLIDFGSATVWQEWGWERPRSCTVGYAAPELLCSKRSRPECTTKDTGPALDGWAYGVTALDLLIGCGLFSPQDPWDEQYTGDLHKQWEETGEVLKIHAKFQEDVAQLAEVSEAFYEEGVSFLKSLLQCDPAKRMTADAALSHPFLTTDFNSPALDALPSRAVQDYETLQPSLLDPKKKM